jgi:hypothetical protein
MKIKIVLSAAVLFMGAAVLQAADMNAIQSTNNTPFALLDANSDQMYRNLELDLEGFGTATVNDRGLNSTGQLYHRHFGLGMGAGGEFFFCRYVGIEAEGFSDTTHHSFVNDCDGNLVLRLPIGNTGLAPYIFGGGGHEWVPVDSNYGEAGGGLEFRFTQMVGIFADGRFIVTDHANNHLMGRLGVKFSF